MRPVFATTVAIWALSYLALANDVDTIYDRQVDFILDDNQVTESQIRGYVASLQSNGTWSEVNYAAGCTAQRSSWPAGAHWTRILGIAVAYAGKVPALANNNELRDAIRKAMAFWFANDMSTIGSGDCMDREYLPNSNCPCGTPGLWGPNWFSNVIQVPTLVGKTCTLLRPSLTESELGNCTLITSRAYAPFYREARPSYVSGANIFDMAVIGVSAALMENNRTGNASRIEDAYARAHNQIVVSPGDLTDGIKPDFSFQQHLGVLYDGNYGKDLSNSFIELELQALGTQFEANKTTQDTFGDHIRGSRWMTYTNIQTKVVHWDLSTIGRFISYPVSDTTRASAGLQMDLDKVLTLGKAWNQKYLLEFGTLTGVKDTTANSGSMDGVRMYWSSDYMVHRSRDTVTTVKLLSKRTTSPKCSNNEGPFALHLADGLTYTYTTGAEYEDIFATLDYNIPPGVTTQYAATPLSCATAQQKGVDTYAGGVPASDSGVAAMRFTNPLDKAFGFYKAWFFFPNGVQHVLVSNIRKSENSSAPIKSGLDQRLRSGDVFVDGELVTEQGLSTFSCVEKLWHAGTGYLFSSEQDTTLALNLETRTGNWSAIGVSKQPPSTKDIFTAWVDHTDISVPLEYSVFPATKSQAEFSQKASKLAPKTVVNSDEAAAATDSRELILGAAFWKESGGVVDVPSMGIQVSVNRGVILVIRFHDKSHKKGTLFLADPNQTASDVDVRITWKGKGHRSWEGCHGHHCPPARRRAYGNKVISLTLALPQGSMAGSTVTQQLKRGD